MNERLKYALFGGISYGLLFAIIVLITGRFFLNWDFNFSIFIRSAPILVPLFVILVGMLGILVGKLLGINNPGRKSFVRASMIALFVTLWIFALFIAILYFLSMLVLAGIDVPPEPYIQIPQIEEAQRLSVYVQCGTVSGSILGIIFGFFFGIILPATNRIKATLLGILYGVLGFGFGGLLSGGIIPVGDCLLLKTNLPLWRLVLDGTIFGFFGGAGMGLFQQYTKYPKDYEGAVFNE